MFCIYFILKQFRHFKMLFYYHSSVLFIDLLITTKTEPSVTRVWHMFFRFFWVLSIHVFGFWVADSVSKDFLWPVAYFQWHLKHLHFRFMPSGWFFFPLASFNQSLLIKMTPSTDLSISIKSYIDLSTPSSIYWTLHRPSHTCSCEGKKMNVHVRGRGCDWF